MEVLFLGTGTSHGVPVIGCDCRTCRSEDPRDKRLRTSVLVSVGGLRILIDPCIDLRQQCLVHGIDRVDAILFTHHHVDHIFGLDDTRPFNFRQRTKMPCFASPDTCRQLRHTYSYIFEYPDLPGGIPMIDLNPVEGPFNVGETVIEPVPILHGGLPIYAYRIGDFIYATDCSGIPESSWKHFENAGVLVLDCLRFRPHPTHFHLDQAVEVALRIRARQTYFTHISHDLLHREVSALLPESIRLAYDGLNVTC
jgi:phosphoribosyl 1,2-cyclic phosphate phosphodiesterase